MLDAVERDPAGAAAASFSVQAAAAGRTGTERISTIDGPEVTVLSGATAIPDGQSAAIGCGTSQQGGSRPTKTFTVRNDGTLPLATSVVDVPRGALDVTVVINALEIR